VERAVADILDDDTAANSGVGTVNRPAFALGDAVLFDEMAMHRTGVNKSMTQTRYAIEMWFFAGSMLLRQQVLSVMSN
jgi:ectoine hydroxylase-related dioxygenase (phytanoyl-CoA dioxygenase family)